MIDGPLDWQTMCLVRENLVSGITVETTGQKRNKQSTVTVTHAFAESTIAVDNGDSPA